MTPRIRVSISWSVIAVGTAAVFLGMPWGPLLLAGALIVWYWLRLVLKPAITSGSQNGTSSLLSSLMLYGLVTIAGLLFVYGKRNSTAGIIGRFMLVLFIIYFVWEDLRNASNLQKNIDKEHSD